jgi:ankyrin repeat protein
MTQRDLDRSLMKLLRLVVLDVHSIESLSDAAHSLYGVWLGEARLNEQRILDDVLPLIEAGANPNNKICSDFSSAAHLFCDFDAATCLSALLGKGAKVPPEALLWCIHTRGRRSSLKAAQTLLASGRINPDNSTWVLDAHGHRRHFPLIRAAEVCDPALISLLLTHGADANVTDLSSTETTALEAFCAHHKLDYQRAFDSLEPWPLVRDTVDAIAMAMRPEERQNAATRSLIFAANSRSITLCQHLRERYGADPRGTQLSIGFAWGPVNAYTCAWTAKQPSPAEDFGEGLDALIALGADVNGYGSETPLHADAGVGALEIVTALLERGANPLVQDASGLSPSHYAAKHGYSEVVALIKSATALYRARAIVLGGLNVPVLATPGLA